ncbi:MAG: ADOP family duplicated permease [Gemmatimonadaceae bacterium]
MPSPPRLAMWLLEHRVPEHEREYLVGDLVEAFHETCAVEGPSRARRRFWREAIAASIRPHDDPNAIPFTRGLMSDIGFDLSLAARRLRRSPGFTLTASLTLALGVGAASAITAIARPALWGALPFREADRIVTLREGVQPGVASRVGYLTIDDIRRESTTLAKVAAVRDWSPTLSDGNQAVRLSGLAVSADFLDAMGVGVAEGRPFAPEEDRPGSATVVLLTHGAWLQHFGGDSSIVGRIVRLSDIEHRVVGILPASFESVLRPGAEIVRPLAYTDTSGSACRDCRHLQAIARLKDGVPLETARQEIDGLFLKMREAYPDKYGKTRLIVTPLRDQMVEQTRGPLLALLGAAALLLLIALANATNLFLARGVRRGTEATIRAALGANRWRLARSTLLEALLVSALGGLFGFALAHAALGGLLALAPSSLPRLDQVRLDAPMIGFVIGLVFLLGAISGLFPAFFMHDARLRDRLASSSRSVARGGHDLVRRSLVVSELALALLLLFGAGILVQSVQRLLAVDVGFATDDRLAFSLSATGTRFESDDVVRQLWRDVLQRVSAIPGVTSATMTSQLPLSSDFDTWGAHWERTASDAGSAGGTDGDVFRFAVTPEYARTMGLHLVAGRFLEPGDVTGGDNAVVINEALAQRRFGDRSPLGERLRIGPPDAALRTVVGVVSDVRHPSLDLGIPPQLYLPIDQNAFADAFVRLVVQSSTEPDALIRQVREAVRSVNSAVPVGEVTSLSALVDRASSQRRFAERLFRSFALAALALAAVGIFGVFSGMVGERVREIGVRSALGATREQILGHFLSQGSGLAVAGIAIGVVGASLLGEALRPLVYGISPRDPVTISVVALALGVVALASTMGPAWRASRIEAMEALRSE